MINVKLAYYRKKDWEKFISMIDDRESMHDNWKDWHKTFLKTKSNLIAQGFTVSEVEIDLNELAQYCQFRRIKNDGQARSQFVQTK
jgi:hypothetical protein